MKKRIVFTVSLIVALFILTVLYFVSRKLATPEVMSSTVTTSAYDLYNAAESGADAMLSTGVVVSTWETYQESEVLLFSGVSVELPKQPVALPGNYQDNTKVLQNWRDKNRVTLAVPANIKNATITFKLTKKSKYPLVPGNIIVKLDWKTLCNGRLSAKGAIEVTTGGEYTYDLTNVSTQDKTLKDWSIIIWKEITVSGFIGEHNNRLEKVIIKWVYK